MALAILPQPVHTIPLDSDVCALARELQDEEGLPIRAALVLADMQLAGLAAYATAWDQWAHAQKEEGTTVVERCPMCDARIVGRQYYVGGRGYLYFDVCGATGATSAGRHKRNGPSVPSLATCNTGPALSEREVHQDSSRDHATHR